MSEFENEQVEGVSIAGVALRLEEEHERDALGDYRRRRNLTEADAVPYTAGLEVGAAWAAEAATAAGLATAWRLAEGLPRTMLSDFEASVMPFLSREAALSQKESSMARFSPEIYSRSSSEFIGWDFGEPFGGGIIDAAAAVWDVIQREDPGRAAALADPGAPANRAAYLEFIDEDPREPEFGSCERRGARRDDGAR